MARIIFTSAEQTKIERILRELDPGRHELTYGYRDRLPRHDWRFVQAYVRKELRSLLELTVMALAIAETATERGLANDDGVNDFLASRSWVRNFDIADEDDERFMAIARAAGRPDANSNYDLCADADTLLEIAVERLRGTVDDEYRELLREMGA